MSHIYSSHPHYLQEVEDGNKNSLLTNYFHSDHTKNVYGWLRWILTASLPFETVSKEIFRDYTTLSPIAKNTFMKYMELLTKVLEKKISKILPDKFAIVFDGWSLDGTSTHFVAIFAKWVSPSNVACTALLAFSPLLDESDFSAESHYEFIRYVLVDVFQKNFSNVICLVGDNCSTNKALAELCQKPLIGCAAHRFNLAVQKFLQVHDVLLTKVNNLMAKLRTLKNAGKLRELSPLRPQLRCATRWTGTHQMIKRFFDLLPHIEKLAEDDDVLSDLMPTMSELKALGLLSEKLSDLSSVMEKLQNPTLNLSHVRKLFDVSMGKYPDLKPSLSPDAKIVHSPFFESGIVKLLRKQNSKLTDEELNALECLKVDVKHSVVMNSNETPKTFADLILQDYEPAIDYLDVSFSSLWLC